VNHILYIKILVQFHLGCFHQMLHIDRKARSQHGGLMMMPDGWNWGFCDELIHPL